jgi:hypothetical protein
MKPPQCNQCAETQARLETALQERDEALLQLARANEELNRRQLAEKWAQEESIPPYPLEAGTVWPVPLRYRVADAVNSWVKKRSPRVQQMARSWMRWSYDE